ncbi:MAG TPA: hypothetical protein DDX40_02295 [Rikenellaceae bacterium]|nr:hypothetical protein [Rikenellaceae bacterium]
MDTKKPSNIEQYQGNFSESGFWNKVKKVAQKAGAKVIYVALILYYELMDPNVSPKEKAIIIGALGYFILPIDLIPDAIPVAGFTDDLAALMAAYAYVKVHLTPEVRFRAQSKMSEWFDIRDFNAIDPDKQ